MSLNARHRLRFGYPTKRVPDPERPRKKRMAYHNDLAQYVYRKFRGVLRLHQLHATKGWRPI